MLVILYHGVFLLALLFMVLKNPFENLFYPSQDRKWIYNLRKEGRMYFAKVFTLLSTPVIWLFLPRLTQSQLLLKYGIVFILPLSHKRAASAQHIPKFSNV